MQSLTRHKLRCMHNSRDPFLSLLLFFILRRAQARATPSGPESEGSGGPQSRGVGFHWVVGTHTGSLTRSVIITSFQIDLIAIRTGSKICEALAFFSPIRLRHVEGLSVDAVLVRTVFVGLGQYCCLNLGRDKKSTYKWNHYYIIIFTF